ncbi:sulfite oxidase heme-binding subunit YedZ [Roseiflexus sp.]|uniref:sulfite oxidase heme-binding subunit YedZ n=1 Tax=Roseiflexus sp. TaxID=2562120 RepID=UPI00398AE23F
MRTMLKANWIHLVHLVGLAPLALLAWDAFTGRLTVNPIQYLTQRTGYAAIVLLVLSLTCTPLSIVGGWKRVLALRRPLGLYSFLYAVLHMMIFTALDFGLDLALIVQEIAEKRYILVGAAALLLLAPLALTSTKGWQRRLGRSWKRLHRLVYLAAPLALVHYAWSQKSDIRQPLILGFLAAVALILRLPLIRRRIEGWRRARSSRSDSAIISDASQRRPAGDSHPSG